MLTWCNGFAWKSVASLSKRKLVCLISWRNSFDRAFIKSCMWCFVKCWSLWFHCNFVLLMCVYVCWHSFLFYLKSAHILCIKIFKLFLKQVLGSLWSCNFEMSLYDDLFLFDFGWFCPYCCRLLINTCPYEIGPISHFVERS